jgi:parallel beta-helix repeat protein
MKKVVHQMIIALLFSLLFTLSANASRFGGVSTLTFRQSYEGDILYVGGNGLNNYSKIQDAIDNASAGDIIFVYCRESPYFENIIINKNDIKLIGEDKYSTIIDGSNIRDVIQIIADRITVHGFTLQHSGSIEYPEYDAGVHLIYPSDHNSITDNIVIDNLNGICLQGSKNNSISKNVVSNNVKGLFVFVDSVYNVISENNIGNNDYGIFISSTVYNTIIENNIVNSSECGLYLNFVRFQTIQRNNFINNSRHVYFIERLRLAFDKNYWIRNYWDNWAGFGPKLLKGEMFTEWVGQILVPWINFDWFPVNKPYILQI